MDRGLSAKEARHAIYIALMGMTIMCFLMGIAFDLKMRDGEGVFRNIIPLVGSLVFINYWYFKSEKFFVDPYEEYDVKDHIIKNGNKYKGNVVHIKENFVVNKNKEKLESTVVIEFLKDGKKQHILLDKFPYMIRVFDVSEKPITEANYLKLSQYTSEEGVISFEKLGEDLEETYFEGIIERNFEGVLSCDIYEYRGRYIIGNIPGYELELEGGFNIKNDTKGYRNFTIKVFVVFCILAKIYAEFLTK